MCPACLASVRADTVICIVCDVSEPFLKISFGAEFQEKYEKSDKYEIAVYARAQKPEKQEQTDISVRRQYQFGKQALGGVRGPGPESSKKRELKMCGNVCKV